MGKVQFRQRLDKPEACYLIEGKNMARHHAAVMQGDPDGFRFRHQVTDCEDQTVGPDERTVAGSLRTEYLGREGIFRNQRPNADDGGQDLVELELVILRIWRHAYRYLSRRPGPQGRL